MLSSYLGMIEILKMSHY